MRSSRRCRRRYSGEAERRMNAATTHTHTIAPTSYQASTASRLNAKVSATTKMNGTGSIIIMTFVMAT